MASGGEEAPEQSGSTTSQLQQGGQLEAAADNHCPICLGEIRNAAFIDGCFHTFCFSCIWRWTGRRAACPVCRQPFHCILHSVRADDDYRQYVVSSSSRQQRTAAYHRERVRSRSPQRRYHLRRRSTTSQTIAGRRGAAGRHRGPRGNAAPGHFNAAARQAAEEPPADPRGGPVPHYNLLALGERVFDFTETE